MSNPAKDNQRWQRALDDLLADMRRRCCPDVKSLVADAVENPGGGIEHIEVRNSRERSLAMTKIQEAMQWLQADLQEDNQS